ncbi:MAG: MFS transporter [Actinophytocola sp.]|uniref:MFS transporter n=1 Tax=Actinophytocola sp. TaxID=1872138 RepID=UPI0013240D4D|nr:MFS transporter [Actinophytocola sp.]MPZ85828.1 MFS transporter [Actinophytocola sp.]
MARWSVIVVFALLGAVTQVLWVTFAPVTDAASSLYGVSDSAIGWLANVFPLLYVLLAIPAGMVLDRWFRGGLGLGAVLTAVGALLRLGDGYGWALFGQLVVGVAQPLVLNAITGVASRYLPPADRPTGIAIGSASTFAGLIVGFGLGAVFASPDGIRSLLLVQAGLAVAVAVAVLAAMRKPAPDLALVGAGSSPAGGGSVGEPAAGGEPASAGFGAVREALRDPVIRRLCALVFVPFGVFVSLTTFAQPLLEPAGVSESTAGLILVANVVAGVVGCAIVPVLASRHRVEVRVMGVALLVTALACVALAVVPGVTVGFVAVIALGFALLPALPIVLELTERRSGRAEGTATGLIWLTGNLGGLVLAAVVGVLVAHPGPAFLLLAVLSLLTLPLLRLFRSSLSAIRR